jgi:hypothetical protein
VEVLLLKFKTLYSECFFHIVFSSKVGRDSTVGIATRYGLDGPVLDPGRGEVFCTWPDWLWSPPSLLYNGYRVFPWGKAAGPWLWPPTPSNVEVKERVGLYLYSTAGPSWPVIWWTVFYLYIVTFSSKIISMRVVPQHVPSVKSSGSDLVKEEATIPCLFFCHEKHCVSRAYYCLQCENFHCFAESRPRFCRNRTGVQECQNMCYIAVWIDGLRETMGLKILGAFIAYHTTISSSRNGMCIITGNLLLWEADYPSRWKEFSLLSRKSVRFVSPSFIRFGY